MSNCKPVITPLAAHIKLSTESCPASAVEIEKMYYVLYFSAVGSLTYAMVCTRPELAYVVRVVRHYVHNLGEDH